MRVCAFFVTILITVTATAQSPLMEELQLARKYFELNEFERARINFESLEVHNALSLEDAKRLAICYESLGENEEAIYRWQEVLKFEDYEASDLLSLAQLLKMEARYDESLNFLRLYRQRGGANADHFIESCEFAQQIVENESNCDLENLQINTSSAESGVTFFGEDIVYATHRVDLSARFGLKGGLDKRPTSVIMSAKTDAYAPENSRPLKVQELDGESFGFVSYAANGRLMVFVRSKFNADASGVDKAHQGMALYYSQPNLEGGWEEDKAFPFNSTEYDNGFPFVSENGDMLYFASDMPGGYGGFDLYVSKYQNNTWSQPMNLGASVNTQGNEITPYLADGKLYFASDWLPGLGGYDVYSIHNVEDQWQDLAHLGACVNSPSDDFGFVVDPQRKSAYFTSTRKGGKGKDDIYRIGDVNGISEIDLVSTEIVEVPVITTKPEKLEASEVKPASIATSDDMKIVINDVSDIAKVESELIRMRQIMNHQLSSEEKHITTNDLPDLNMNIGLNRLDEPVRDETKILNTIETAPYTQSITYKGLTTTDIEVPEVVVVDSEELLETEQFNSYEWTDNEVMELGNVTVKGLRKTVTSHPSFEELEIQLLAAIKTEIAKNREVETARITEDLEIEVSEAVEESSVVAPEILEESLDLTGVLMFDDPYLKTINMAPQEKVYFIQIAALKSYTSNLDRFNHFKRYGNVYKISTGGMIKIRIGYYHSQAEAVSVLRDLKKRGIQEAFVVGDILDESRLELIASPLDDEAGEVINLSNGDLVPSYASKYKVRVASYQWPSQFQTSKIVDLGHLEHWTKGPWKIIVLSGYTTRSQADEVLRTVKARGYDDSFVVQDRNGTLQRIE